MGERAAIRKFRRCYFYTVHLSRRKFNSYSVNIYRLCDFYRVLSLPKAILSEIYVKGVKGVMYSRVNEENSFCTSMLCIFASFFSFDALSFHLP